MTERNYWDRIQRRRVDRRSLLQASARAGVGAAGLALVGCGDDDDDDAAVAQSVVDQTDQAVDQTDQAVDQTDQAVDQAEQAAQAVDQAEQAVEQADAGEDDQPVAQPDDGIARGGTLKAYWPIEESHLDPHSSREHFSAVLWRTVSNGILSQEPITAKPRADLAQDWETPEPTVFIFNLHENVRFHDKAPVNGRAFTAEDAAYSLARLASRLDDGAEAGTYPRASSFSSVLAFEAPDLQTLRVVTEKPFAPLLSFISNKWSVMVAKEVVEEFGDLRKGETAIGTGPFIVEEADSVRGARVVRNPDYFKEGLPYLDAIEWTVVSDPSAQEAAYVSDQSAIHGSFGTIPGTDLPRFASRDDTTIHEYPLNSFLLGAIGGPNTKGPLMDVRVRQAINLAIDRADIGRVAYPGSPLSEASYMASPLWGLSTEEVLTLPGWGDKELERQEARQLLDAAGYPDGFTLVTNTTELYPSYHIDRAVVVQPQLAEIGITADLNILEFGALKELETARDFEFTIASYAFFDDPDSQLFNAFHSDGSRNYWEFQDETYNAMVEDQRSELDVDTRIEKVKEAQRYLHEMAPVAADDWFRFGNWATKNYLQGFEAGSSVFHAGAEGWWIDENA